MNLKKRIEKLELIQKQNMCEHSFHVVSIERIREITVQVTSMCFSCNKKHQRDGHGKEMLEAFRLLQDFLYGKN